MMKREARVFLHRRRRRTEGAWRNELMCDNISEGSFSKVESCGLAWFSNEGRASSSGRLHSVPLSRPSNDRI